jgi:tetratricopeptide (TPR) repeat protein
MMFRKGIALLLWAVPFIGAAQNIDLLILNKNYPEALSQISRKLEVQADAELYLKQANIYQQLSKPLYAAQSLENSIALDSTNSKYLSEYAELQAELGNPYKAVKYFKKAVDNSKDDLNLKCRLGKAYMNIEDYKNAFDIFSLIQIMDSTDLVYNKQLGLAASRIGEIDLAISRFEKVLEYNPNDFSTYMNLISLYLKNKDAVQIIRTSDRALYFFPENTSILYREANSLYVLKEYEEARLPFERYLAKSDSVFDVLENYGITLYFNHDELKARKIMEKCFALNPTDQFVNFYLGLICKKLVDFPKCVEYLNMAIAASQPAYLTEMYHLLGQVFGLQREFEKSIEALKEAFKCNPLKYEILVEIATTYEEFNPNKKLALNYYQKYLKEAGNEAVNAKYALERISKIEENIGRGKKSD